MYSPSYNMRLTTPFADDIIIFGVLSHVPLWWNWYTRQVEGLCLNGHAGSSPVGGIKKGGGGC